MKQVIAIASLVLLFNTADAQWKDTGLKRCATATRDNCSVEKQQKKSVFFFFTSYQWVKAPDDCSLCANIPEVCNGIDDNLNGAIDEGFTQNTLYRDADGDGYGDVTSFIFSCETSKAGYTLNFDDCDDTSPLIHPNAPDLCNVIDDDCDGRTDEDAAYSNFYADVDRDGYGAGDQISSCSTPPGTVLNNGDCDDSNAAIHPGATEIVNGIDDDCDGAIEITAPQVNPLINGYCDELSQWDREHFDISMYSEPFNTNYSQFHSGFGMFSQGIGSVHYITPFVKGMGSVNCKPDPRSTATCNNTPTKDCEGDGVGCQAHTLDYYSEQCHWYADHGISMIVNINPYVKNWSEQKKYIDVPLSNRVKVIGVIFGTELAVPSWYANSFYYPKGGSDYVPVWTSLKDSIHKYYPGIPVGVWTGNIWQTRGDHYNWCSSITAAGKGADFIAAYGMNQNITNRLNSTNQTEAQAIDSILTFPLWLSRWQTKVASTYGKKEIAILTNGTNGTETLGPTFLGLMQTEFQIMAEQMDEGNLMAAQEYRTREFKLNGNAAKSQVNVQVRFKRGEMYTEPCTKEWLQTGDKYVVGIRFTKADGHGWVEVLNFSSRDWSMGGIVEGWSCATTLLNDIRQGVSYTDNKVRARSIAFVEF